MRNKSLVRAVAILAVIAISWASAASDSRADAGETYFVFIFHRGPAWADGVPMREQPSVDDHFAHMEKLQNAGQLILGGPFADETGAMGILKLGELAEAQRIMQADPLVRAGVVTMEIHPWRPSVSGCIKG